MLGRIAKKVAALAVGLVLAMAIAPAAAFAIDAADNPTSYGYDTSPADQVTVDVTISNDSIPLRGNDANETILSNLRVTVPYFDLADYGLEEFYRYETDEEGNYTGDMRKPIHRPTLLHLYIYLLEHYYLGLEDSKCGNGALFDVGGHYDVYNMYGAKCYTGSLEPLLITGNATSMYMFNFWGHDENLMYFRNHCFPLQRAGWGSTADYILISDGDKIDLGMFTDWSFYSSGGFTCFDHDNYTIASESKLTIYPLTTATSVVDGSSVSVRAFGERVLVGLYDSDWNELEIFESDSNVAVSYEGYPGVGFPLTIPCNLDPGTYHLVSVDGLAGSKTARHAPATATLNVIDYMHEHQFVKHAAREADCGHMGNPEYYTCKFCDAYFSDVEGTIADPKSLFSPKVGEHEMGEWTTAIEPDCVMDGQKVSTCTKCGFSTYETIPAPGHDYASAVFEWKGRDACTVVLTCGTHDFHQKLRMPAEVTSKVTKPATCTEDGVRTYTATLPAGSGGEGNYRGSWSEFRDVKTETVPATGVHKPIDVAEVPATCIEPGASAGTKCSLCGDVLSGCQPIPAKGHVFGAWAQVKAASVASTGLKQRSCAQCGKTEQIVIPMLGPKAGSVFTSQAGTFKVQDVAKRTVVFVSPFSKSSKVVTVPASAMLQGKSYKVVGIAPKAFAGSKATKIVIKSKRLTKKSVKKCFKGSKVKTVKVPKSKKAAYKKAFAKKNCGKKVSVSA